MAASPIIQYVIVRGDLKSKMQWPMGAVIAQACHACTAVTHLFYKDETTQEYLADLDNMHKCVLEVNVFINLRVDLPYCNATTNYCDRVRAKSTFY